MKKKLLQTAGYSAAAILLVPLLFTMTGSVSDYLLGAGTVGWIVSFFLVIGGVGLCLHRDSRQWGLACLLTAGVLILVSATLCSRSNGINAPGRDTAMRIPTDRPTFSDCSPAIVPIKSMQ